LAGVAKVALTANNDRLDAKSSFFNFNLPSNYF
jgi:hypothetical protein